MVEMKQSDGLIYTVMNKSTTELYFFLTSSLHSSIQTRQFRVNKGPLTHTSYKFTIRHVQRTKKKDSGTEY